MDTVRRASLFAIALAATACSSKDNGGTASTNDAGGNPAVDGATSNGDEGGTSDSSLPPGATQATCEASILYRQRCADTAEAKSDGCAAGRRQTCDALVATMTASYAAAYATCATPQVSCDEGPDTCITTELKKANVGPTAAQSAVRDHFCATCASDGCADGFFTLDTENGNGPGYLVFIGSDAVAAKVDQQCTGPALQHDAGADECVNAFRECAADAASSLLPDDPDACYPPYVGDDDAGTDGG